MKSMTVVFEDREHEKLVEKKNSMNLNWHNFIMTLVDSE